MGDKMKGVVLGIVTIVIAVILFPLITGATDTILAANITAFTGLSSITQIVPLIVLVGMMAAGGWMAVRGFQGKEGDVKETVYGILTVYIGLVLFPIIITTFNDLIDTGLGSYTGLQSIVAIVPLLLLIGMTIGGGMLMWKGTRG